MFDRRGFVLGWIIVALILAGYYGAREWPHFETNLALRAVRACAEENNTVVCSRPQIQALLRERTGAEVMSLIAPRLQPMTCHYIGHVVGQEEYLKTRSVEPSLERCNRSCDSACIHGVVGAAFAESLGITDLDSYSIDLAHLEEESVRKAGTRLCATIGACHGVGHSLFQLYLAIEPAFERCREVAGNNLPMCYNGAAMEYADMLSSRNTNVLNVVEPPTEEDFASFCEFPTIVEQRACFRYFPRIMVESLKPEGIEEEEALARYVALCDAYENDMTAITCYGGFGSYWSYLVRTDTDAAVRSCEELGSDRKSAACRVGQLGVATEDRGRELARVCAASRESLRPLCYQGLFYFLERVNFSDERQALFCSPVDDACAEGLRNKLQDPITIIRSMPL